MNVRGIEKNLEIDEIMKVLENKHSNFLSKGVELENIRNIVLKI